MPKGILFVESCPSSPERTEEYNRWYNEVHIPDVLRVPGFVRARRFVPADGDGPFVAVYEVEGDDLQAVFAGLAEAAQRGDLPISDAMQMDPPPSVRLFELVFDSGTTS